MSPELIPGAYIFRSVVWRCFQREMSPECIPELIPEFILELIPEVHSRTNSGDVSRADSGSLHILECSLELFPERSESGVHSGAICGDRLYLPTMLRMWWPRRMLYFSTNHTISTTSSGIHSGLVYLREQLRNICTSQIESISTNSSGIYSGLILSGNM